MESQLKEIRERLQDAVNNEDWWVVKSQMNKLDTIIYNESQIKIEISHIMPNGNIWLSIDGINLLK